MSSLKIEISQTVVRPCPLRCGIVIGPIDRYGASQPRKNLLPNPGIECGRKACIFVPQSGSTLVDFWVEYWNTTWLGMDPEGAWEGANWEFMAGPLMGQSGIILGHIHDPVTKRMRLQLSMVPTSVDPQNRLAVWRTVVGAENSIVSLPNLVDTTEKESGSQSLRLAPGEWSTTYSDTFWRDGNPNAHKLNILEPGTYRFNARARSENGSEGVRIEFRRFTSDPPVLDRVVRPGITWSEIDLTFHLEPGEDAATVPWPAGQYHDILELKISAGAANAGAVWFDRCSLERLSEVDNDTAFSDRFIDRLADLRPGVLRFWGGQFGSTLGESLLAAHLRRTASYQPNKPPRDWAHGTLEAFDLCELMGALPWLVIPPTTTQVDVNLFMSVIGVHLDRFEKIYLEFSNESWGSGLGGDPFAGASLGDPGFTEAATRVFGWIRAHVDYDPNKIRLVLGGQASYPGRQVNIEVNSTADVAVIAPYVGGFQADSTENLLKRIALQLEEYHGPGGLYSQSQDALTSKALGVYEFNFHQTSPVSGMTTAQLNEIQSGAAGALLIPLQMLRFLERGAEVQAAFAALQHSFKFQSTGDPAEDYANLWGLLRDLYGISGGAWRPAGLGLILANRAIVGDLVGVSRSGTDPQIEGALLTSAESRCISAVQAWAFSSPESRSVMMMNLDPLDAHRIELCLPYTPDPSATLYQIAPSELSMNNEGIDPEVQIEEIKISDFSESFELVLPRHSVQVLIHSPLG